MADYTAKGSDIAIIPIRAEYVKDGTTYSNTYQLSVKWTDLSKKYTPVIKKVSEDVITEKNKKVELSVEIEPIDGDGTVSYQWYWRKWNYRPSGIWEGQKVDGATQATFTPPTTEAQTNMWYACQVSYTTADGKTYTTTSEFIRYTVNLGTPNDPIIIRQPGTFTMVNRTEILENTFKALTPTPDGSTRPSPRTTPE